VGSREWGEKKEKRKKERPKDNRLIDNRPWPPAYRYTLYIIHYTEPPNDPKNPKLPDAYSIQHIV